MKENSYFSYKNRLWNRLEREVLPFVSKPGRYVGNELNAVIKDHTGKFRIALAFPDIYEIGMSYLGQQILYHLINKRDDCLAERVFQVWPDMEERLRQLNIPIFSLETSTPLKEFDLIGFSVTYEMHSPGILNILDLAGIPFKSQDRNEGHPLIIAGGPAVLNPEPIADFFDAIFIGDAEEAINEIIDSLVENRNAPVADRLRKLARIEGIYVPAFYKAVYQSGNFKSIEPQKPGVPAKVKIRSCLELKAENYPARPLVPFVGITHDRLAIEIMRGCVTGCRFCQAGYQYRPRRFRRREDIAKQIRDSFTATGFDEISLVSLSSTDYPDLEQTIEEILPFIQQNHLALSLPSLRPGSLSGQMLGYLKSQRKTSITFAPEAGTQRLRDVIGKNITEEQIFDGVKAAFERGWTLVKLYFMVGLPSETDDDIQGIIETVENLSYMIKTMRGKKNINVTISPFCPKPGTPWQWEEQAGPKRISEIYDRLSSGLKARNVILKFHNPRLSVVEGILARGDRRLSDVIIKAYRNGARLDGWSEHFSFDAWNDAIYSAGLDIDDLLKARVAHESLPWEHIEKGISQKYLLDERQRSLSGKPPSKMARAKKAPISADSFGRPLRKQAAVSVMLGRTKIRIKYSRDERLRFYSHLDIMRSIARAIRRAGLPVSYSQGFHPRMKLSLGPPLALGYISSAEYLDLQLDSPFEKSHLSRLNASLPDGMDIIASKLMFSRTDSLAKIINCASYVVKIDQDIKIKVDELKDGKDIVITRTKDGQQSSFAAGRFIYDISYGDGICEMLLGHTDDGYIRPNEVMVFGLGLSPCEALPLVYKRTGQYLCRGLHKIDPIDMV